MNQSSEQFTVSVYATIHIYEFVHTVHITFILFLFGLAFISNNTKWSFFLSSVASFIRKTLNLLPGTLIQIEVLTPPLQRPNMCRSVRRNLKFSEWTSYDGSDTYWNGFLSYVCNLLLRLAAMFELSENNWVFTVKGYDFCNLKFKVQS